MLVCHRGRIGITNNATERALGGIARGRNSRLLAGSDRGGLRAAVMFTRVGTTQLNDVDPQAWLAGVLDRNRRPAADTSARTAALALEGRAAVGPGRIEEKVSRGVRCRRSDASLYGPNAVLNTEG